MVRFNEVKTSGAKESCWRRVDLGHLIRHAAEMQRSNWGHQHRAGTKALGNLPRLKGKCFKVCSTVSDAAKKPSKIMAELLVLKDADLVI